MRRAAWSLVLIGVLAFGLSACESETQAEPKEQPDPALAARLAPSYNSFGFGLFRESVAASDGKNVVLSPLSVAIALTMAYNGAGGQTRAEMERMLNVTGMSLADVNAATAALRQSLAGADAKVRLDIANSIWARQGFAFEQDFLDRNRRLFDARVSELDFGGPAAVDVINAWVSENTNGRIDSIIDEINADQVMFLINAVYFKGEWKARFDPARTTDGSFRLADGTSKTVPMMSQGGEYLYLQADGAQVLTLPYGDGRFNMTLMLPPEGVSAAELAARLDAATWADWLARLRPMDGDIALPRFKLSYKATLNEQLKALGMRDAFDEARADFSGMRRTPPSLVIDEVKHKTFIEVNEEGTEAAAVTSIGVRVTSAGPRFRFVADRPFLFAIQDSQTGAVMFLGAISDPS
ncbi:MAG: serpin family protein [Chloroflexi bacterium]|nr:serpin family protein [Chloroflexota bacterium]